MVLVLVSVFVSGWGIGDKPKRSILLVILPHTLLNYERQRLA